MVRLYCISRSQSINCIEISGLSLGFWFDYSKKNKDFEQAVKLGAAKNDEGNHVLTFENIPDFGTGVSVSDARKQLSDYVNWNLHDQLEREKQFNSGEYVDPRQVAVSEDLKELAKATNDESPQVSEGVVSQEKVIQDNVVSNELGDLGVSGGFEDLPNSKEPDTYEGEEDLPF